MIGTSSNQDQQDLSGPLLKIYQSYHELALLTDKIDWQYLKTSFKFVFQYRQTRYAYWFNGG